MKLKNIVVDGLFCGMQTVEECIENFYLHSIQMFPYNALEYELRELREDIKKYEAGNLELPWKEINDRVAEMEAHMHEWYRDNEPGTEHELEYRLELLK